MKVAFVVDDTTNAFQPLIGPKDKRVLLLSNAKKNVAKEPIKLALFTANYKEHVTSCLCSGRRGACAGSRHSC
jgi:hypothetical protein